MVENDEQNKFMLVNVAWNHSKWAQLEPNPKANFEYTKSAFAPHESLNFEFLKEGIDDNETVYGYFQVVGVGLSGVPRKFAKGGLIIFWSSNTDDRKGYFIGVYGNAGIIDPIMKKEYHGFKEGKFWANIQGEKRLSCLFPCPVEDSSYRDNGNRLIFRSNLSYDFDKFKALRLLKEAKESRCNGHSDSASVAVLTAIEEYVKDKL